MTPSSPYPTFNTGPLITLTNAGNETLVSSDQANNFGRGVVVFNNLTVLAGGITVNVQGKDTASGDYYTLLSSGNLTGNTSAPLTVYPGGAVTSNVSTSAPLPATWRVQAVINSSGNVTGTIGGSVIA